MVQTNNLYSLKYLFLWIKMKRIQLCFVFFFWSLGFLKPLVFPNHSIRSVVKVALIKNKMEAREL